MLTISRKIGKILSVNLQVRPIKLWVTGSIPVRLKTISRRRAAPAPIRKLRRSRQTARSCPAFRCPCREISISAAASCSLRRYRPSCSPGRVTAASWCGGTGVHLPSGTPCGSSRKRNRSAATGRTESTGAPKAGRHSRLFHPGSSLG